jgi:hypothetical protein
VTTMNRPGKALVARALALVPERRRLGWVSVGGKMASLGWARSALAALGGPAGE